MWIRYFIRFSVLNPDLWSNAVLKTVGLPLQKTMYSFHEKRKVNLFFILQVSLSYLISAFQIGNSLLLADETAISYLETPFLLHLKSGSVSWQHCCSKQNFTKCKKITTWKFKTDFSPPSP